MNYCTNCGHKINPENKYCEGCGKPLQKEKTSYCTKCGNRLNPRNGVCMHCIMESKKSNVEVIKPKVDPDIKKFDLLIKLGILMVLIAGFVLATRTFNHLPKIVSFITFLLLSVIFYGLYRFSNKKIKIKSSTILYFVTSLLFIVIAFISAFHIGIFGKYLSFHGGGKLLSISIILFISSLLFYVCKSKFKSNVFLSLFLITFIFSIVFLLNFFGLGWLTDLAVLSLLILILYMYLKDYNKSIVILGIIKVFLDGIFMIVIRPEYAIISGTVLTVCDGFLMYLFGYNEKNKLTRIFSSIVLFIFFTFFLIYALNNSLFKISFICGVLFLLLLMIVIINYINETDEKNNSFCLTSRIMNISLISSFIIVLIFKYLNHFLSTIYFDVTIYRINLLVCSLVLLISNLLIVKEKSMLHNNLYKFLLIPEIVLVFYALLMFIGIYVKGISIFTFTILLSILAFILYLKSKGKLYGYISYIICFVLLIFSYLGLCQNNRVIIESILGISFLLIPILSLFIYLHEKKHKNRKVYKWLSVVIYGLSVLKLASLDIFSFGNSLSCLIGFVILLLTMLINLDDNIIVYFISVLSIITFANYLDFTSLSQNIICIFISSYALLMSLLFASRFKNRAYNILTIIFFSFIMFIILLNINNVIAIYLALVSIICFIIDILSKKINGLYIVGIVFLAITILYEINTYFKDLPFWIYLLLGGLAIIIFASIKLSKKIKND